MVSVSAIKTALDEDRSIEYQCQANLNLYDSPEIKSLATQAVAGRHLRILSAPLAQDAAWEKIAVQVCLCEDDYQGWLSIEDIDLIEVAEQPYQAIALTKAEIRDRLPQVIAYTHMAMAQPNHYLWGGTIGSNYDCSGLIQAAFTAAGIWLRRDAYQQAADTQAISFVDLQPGDLIFFGSAPQSESDQKRRITHVGLYLRAGYYIHSSGKDQGRNGIAIDPLLIPENAELQSQADEIAQAYHRQLQSAGRVVASYQPTSLKFSG
jgi:cell wall-associated NlpC family hydrolase